jgi:hypothetical protein
MFQGMAERNRITGGVHRKSGKPVSAAVRFSREGLSLLRLYGRIAPSKAAFPVTLRMKIC